MEASSSDECSYSSLEQLMGIPIDEFLVPSNPYTESSSDGGLEPDNRANILQSLGLDRVQQREFAQKDSTNAALLFDLIYDAKESAPTTMTTEELFGVDTTEDCSSSRIDCERDTSVDDMVVDEPEKSCSPDLDDDMEDMQDLYGGRTYGLPSSRPTMISAKYRQKEERRKVMKLSVQKLSRIDDPESSLRRSVLINNTVKRLHRESCEEKSPTKHHRDQVSKSRSPSKCFGISNDFITKQQEQSLKVEVFATSLGGRSGDQLLDITNRPDGKTCISKCDAADCLDCDETISDLVFIPGDHHHHHHHHHQRSSTHHVKMSRKRSLDETTLDDECDVLSHFYMPPAPRTIPSLEDDEDEDVNVVDIDTTPVEPPAKRKREDDQSCCNTSLAAAATSDAVNCCLTAADRLRDNLPAFSSSSTLSSSCTTSSSTSAQSSSSTCSTTASTSSPSLPLPCTSFDDWMDDSSILLQTASSLQAASHTAPTSNYSCGHSSMLNEIAVYHSLIASFET